MTPSNAWASSVANSNAHTSDAAAPGSVNCRPLLPECNAAISTTTAHRPQDRA